MVQNGTNDHFGQNDLIPNRILAFARPGLTKMVHFGPFWPEEVHFGPFRSANRTLAISEKILRKKLRPKRFYVFFWGGGGGVQQNHITTKKQIFQELFCVC